MFQVYSTGLRCGLAACAWFCLAWRAAAIDPRDYAIALSATTSTSPPAILLQWQPAPQGTGYTLHRKALDADAWSFVTTLPTSASQHLDSATSLGQAWEYRLTRQGATPVAYGYLLAGIEVPPRETRGAVLLVVDATQSLPLAVELARLEDDLAGDGWHVRRLDVSPLASVASVKAQIVSAHLVAPLTTVFLLGHVPVPLSGNFAPDGHSEHVGAWSADVFYGELNGPWTDNTVNRTSAADPRNRNVPGDGKYDASTLPSDVDLEVGRVDLSNLPAFGVSETALLRRYLDKNHRFRHRLLVATPRAVIDDHFGDAGGNAYAQTAWRAFGPLVGPANVVAQDWIPGLTTTSALWAYGCSAGGYTNCEGVVTTGDFATRQFRAVFVQVFGSYFGDWESSPGHYTQNNLLRAALGSGDILASGWAGFPLWVLHPMGLGWHLGHSTRLTQNGSGTRYLPVSRGMRQVHVALMGDPTLRQHYVAPPSNLVASVESVAGPSPRVRVRWMPSPEANLGYHVYRAATRLGPYQRLTQTPIQETTWLDVPPAGSEHYQVKALSRVISPSGSYQDMSQGPAVQATPWSDAPLLDNGWLSVAWFGYVFVSPAFEPWVCHWEHGWLYRFGLDPENLWFWDAAMGTYWWTSASQYPYLFRASDGAWLWYQPGSRAPRTFLNLASGRWESRP